MLNLRNYTNEQIDTTLRMRGGSRKVSFRYVLMNKNDIKIGELDGITGKISYGEFRAIPRSAEFELDEYQQRNINFMSDQIQPWFVLHMPDGPGHDRNPANGSTQDSETSLLGQATGGTVEWPLGIFLLESPNRIINGKIRKRNIGAYDKTIILEEDKFSERHFISKGSNYVGAVMKILAMAGIEKINIPEYSAVTLADKEFPIGMKKTEAVNNLLQAINYNSIRVDAEGVFFADPYVLPDKRRITQTYSTKRDSILYPEFTENLDIAGRANVFVRVAINADGNTEFVSTYENNNVMSVISTVSRGRRIVDFEELESFSSQEALDNHVKRVAAESTSAYSHLSFSTALMPGHGSADTLFLDIPEIFSTPTKFSETSWEMNLKYDGEMKHEARKVVEL